MAAAAAVLLLVGARCPLDDETTIQAELAAPHPDEYPAPVFRSSAADGRLERIAELVDMCELVVIRPGRGMTALACNGTELSDYDLANSLHGLVPELGGAW